MPADTSARCGWASSEIASGHREIPSKLLAFRLNEPNVTLELLPMSSQDQIEAVKNAEIDAAIVYDVHQESAGTQLLQYKDIGESEIVLALYKGHRLANARQIRMKDLQGESSFGRSARARRAIRIR